MNFSVNNTTHTTGKVETTEWEDVLVKHGVISERAEVAAARASREEVSKRGEVQVDVEKALSKKTLDELTELEDDVEEDVLDKIREKRLAELKKKASKERFGQVITISKPDFIRHVTEESKTCWVVVEMFKEGIEESSKASELVRQIAERVKFVKFVRIRSTDCVEGWPDSSVPCFFLYHNGVMVEQLVGLDFCGGTEKASVDSLFFAFAAFGVFEDGLEIEDVEEVLKEFEKVNMSRDQVEELRMKEKEVAADREEEEEAVKLRNAAKRTTKSGAVLETLSDDDDDW